MLITDARKIDTISKANPCLPRASAAVRPVSRLYGRERTAKPKRASAGERMVAGGMVSVEI